MTALVSCAALTVLAASAPKPRLALLVGSLPSPDRARLAQWRVELERQYELVSQPDVVKVLEEFTRVPSPEEEVRGALASADQSLRKLDGPRAGRALSAARAAASRLQPTLEGRELMVQEALREASLALMLKDEAGQRQAMSAALSVDPRLTLDPDQSAPALLRLAERTRAWLLTAPRRSLTVESDPPGATVLLAAGTAGKTPLVLPPATGATVVWLTLDGYFPLALRAGVAGESVRVALEPLDVAHRLGPLVEAVRAADEKGRALSAGVLAAALKVDAVAVVEGASTEPKLYLAERPTPVKPPPPFAQPAPGVAARPDAWYRDRWGDSLSGAGLLVLGGAGLAFGVGQQHAMETYSAAPLGTFERDKALAGSWRTAGGIAAGALGALLAAAALRYVLRPGPAVSLTVAPGTAMVMLSAPLP